MNRIKNYQCLTLWDANSNTEVHTLAEIRKWNILWTICHKENTDTGNSSIKLISDTPCSSRRYLTRLFFFYASPLSFSQRNKARKKSLGKHSHQIQSYLETERPYAYVTLRYRTFSAEFGEIFTAMAKIISYGQRNWMCFRKCLRLYCMSVQCHFFHNFGLLIESNRRPVYQNLTQRHEHSY